MPVAKDDVAIVRAIIAMAHSLGLSVLAVEYLAQVEFLKSLNCDVIQGYYYSKPLAVDAFARSVQPKTSGRIATTPRVSLVAT